MSFTFVYQSDSVNDTSINSSTNPTRSTKFPLPSPLVPYDVLLRVAVASLCHTDRMVSAGVMGTKLPCIGSHEGAGTVVHLGSAVTEFKNGDRVMAGLPRNRCGHYSDCLGDENYQQYCPNLARHVGVTLDGAFAEYMIVEGRENSRIPDDVSFDYVWTSGAKDKSLGLTKLITDELELIFHLFARFHGP